MYTATGLNEEGFIAKFNRGNPVGIQPSQVGQNELFIFPNPATDLIHISIPAIVSGLPVDVAILNMEGQHMYHTTLNSGNDLIPVSMLPNGIYLFVMQSNGQVYRKQLIVQR